MFAESPSGRSEHELIALHAHTCFTHDDAGRLIGINEPHGKPAPRFFIAWTRHSSIWRVRHDVPLALVSRLADIVAASPPDGDLDRPPACAAAVRAALSAQASVEDGGDGGPLYCFPPPIDPTSGSAPRPAGGAVGVPTPRPIDDDHGAVLVGDHNAHVLQRWLPGWLADVATQLPILTVLVDGAAVAICACARLPAEATEAGVETHPAFRGHGYAAIATAAWARTMRARGVIPLYSTSWGNTASRRVAAKLGLIQYGASLTIA
jgi:hypothetical protein